MIIFFMLAQFANADIIVESLPTQNQVIEFRVVDGLSRPVAAATVRMVTHPGLSGAKEWTVGLTDSEGRLEYTPEIGGLHRIEVANQSLDFAVRWAHLPLGAVFSYIGLFLLLIPLTLRGRKVQR